MQLFDVLKARAGIPVQDPMAVLFARKTAEKEPLEHYILRIEKNNPHPENRCTYLGDAAGLTPKTISNGAGGWGNAFFVRKNYPVMCKSDGTEDYLLDPLNHLKKPDGTDSDVQNVNYDGNAMSCFDCHIWMKFREDETYLYIEVANRKLDSGFVDFPYLRADGTHADKIYYPMYEGTIVNGKLRSLCGANSTYPAWKPTGNTTASQETAAASANGSCWKIGDWSHHLWITCLCMLMGKTTIVENAFGYGNSEGQSGMSASEYTVNGSCNTFGQFWGTHENRRSAVKTFYCENLYANRLKRTLGFYCDNGTYFIRTAPPYTIDGTHTTYTNCGTAPAQGGVESLKITSCGLVPSTTYPVNTSDPTVPYDTYYGALFSINTTGCHLLRTGGGCRAYYSAGFWLLAVSADGSYANVNGGASLYLVQPSGEKTFYRCKNGETYTCSDESLYVLKEEF